MDPFRLRGKYLISFILLLMFSLEMVIVVWATRDQDHSKLLEHFGRGSDRNNNAEWQSDRDRIRYWRWKNRNRLRNRRARMGLGSGRLNKEPGQKKNLNYRGDLMGKHPIIQTPPELTFVNITESMESCCPTVFEVIEPTSGRNRAGHFVELYRDDLVKQYFYEYSCKKGIMDEPCRFLENRHSRQSRCTQQRTFTYALIRTRRARDENGTSGGHGYGRGYSHGPDAPSILPEPQPFISPHETPPWYLDYISIRSGCACEVVQIKKKRMFKRKGG